MVEGSKQVRVDNWGIFFLQRLQMFFSKTDYCDLTLQFEGNVQLKVHRLVMNACTEYFSLLEESCPSDEENTIIMPTDLQADVIVPIVNFMYTGMLEFHMSIFEKLYTAAEMMNITVLTKLLEAQKVHLQSTKIPKRKPDAMHTWSPQGKKTSKISTAPELPPTLPGRKLPVWKRKNAPVPTQHPTSQMQYSDQKWAQDPLSVPDNTPKPTRFEWPDEDLPPVNLMDTSFEEISYTSKPLLTQEEESRAGTSFDDVRNNVNGHKKMALNSPEATINIRDIEEHAKEQKIRGDLTILEEGEDDDLNDYNQKRKLDPNVSKSSPKRQKINDKENKETTISIKSNNAAEIDHTKIVSEILKKYPQLVKKNKNIRLKIMASGNKSTSEEKTQGSTQKTTKIKVQEDVVNKSVKIIKPQLDKPKEKDRYSEESSWTCQKCIDAGEPPQEFVLYYLYRKHMTDIHNEVFDMRLCKYCGRKCGKHNLMMYHLYTKHGLKPPTTYNFPKCDQCPYIALSPQRLQQHKLRHKPTEMQCGDCKLAFTTRQTLTAHIQITGHYNKAGRSNYDCQYCTKKLQSGINLFSHIKNSHLKEAKRDGIISLDEMDEPEDMEEEEDEKAEDEEEYILPEILPETVIQRDKVKIISNVKVPASREQAPVAQQQAIPLEPSSEAEALSNVASGIATSLGLVDIVVLDDNQQYILQQQENQSGQTEFILPELSSNENPFAGQVITTQHSSVLPQGMLQTSGTDITSTDELVMVLTDHDYQDEQEGTTADNSNIVVLYSHPVDGHQGQFITSQGNLLVNSQTGLLEIRNGATIATTTASSMVVNNAADTPIESIEMIQREIEGHTETKQETYYEEDRKPDISKIQTEPTQLPVEENNPEQHQLEGHVDTEGELANTSTSVEENQTENESLEESTEAPEENAEGSAPVLSEENQEVPNPKEEIEEPVENPDDVDGVENAAEEPMEVDELQESQPENDKIQSVPEESTEDTSTQEEEQNVSEPVEETAPSEENKGEDVPPDADRRSDTIAMYESSETVVINDPSNLYIHADEKHEERELKEVAPEPMEVDGKVAVEEENRQDTSAEDNETEENTEEQVEEGNKENVEDVSGDVRENIDQVEDDISTEQREQSQEDVSQSTSEFHHQSENSNSQYNDEDDENSQSSQGTSQSQENRNQANINQTILEDWEDTDSQQSEKQRVAMKEAAENVNKLMDDWEEEDEEDRREGD